MAESESGQEKTEDPTPKRKRDAREKGQLPRSRDFNAVVVLLSGATTMTILGPELAKDIIALVRGRFILEPADIFIEQSMQQHLSQALLSALDIFVPFFIILMLSAVIGPAIIGGLNFSTKSLAFKIEKLNPLKGIKRIFSSQGLMEFLKTLAKFLVIGGAAALFLRYLWGDLLSLGRESFMPAIGHAMELLVLAFLGLSSTLLIIAFVDVPFQIWQHLKQLRMTRQEVKDEMKDTEGRPEVKGRIRSVQQQISQRRMMQDVPTADVVITNPSHFSVALKYHEQRGAPIVVAKGVGLIALRIRDIAEQNGVQLFAAPPLARALYAGAEIGDQIPRDLYQAVAQVLAYIYQLRTFSPKALSAVKRPQGLEVPGHYDEKLNARKSPQGENPTTDD